jgi:hypothetical protein
LSCFSSISFMGCFKYCGQKIAFFKAFIKSFIYSIPL